jgi:ribosomal protein S19
MSRAKWKGPFINIKSGLKTTDKTPIISRSYEITSQIVGLNFNVHSGKKFQKINITDDMIGHKIGEFSATREKFVFKKKKTKK